MSPSMSRPRLLLLALALLLVGGAAPRPAAAHPAPFSFLDLRLEAGAVQLSLVAHVFDVAHDVGVDPPEQLLQPADLQTHGRAFASLLAPRVRLAADGQPIAIGGWTVVEALPDRQSIRLEASAPVSTPPGVLTIDARLFPYDPAHQTFVNVHERDQLTAQTILDVGRTTFTYYAGTAGGRWAVMRSLIPGGAMHVLVGVEHIVMMLGLLLTRTSLRRAVLIASAFTVGHAVMLTLAALNLLTPPARLVDPAIALTIVYVGVDNLMVHDGRDIRGWISAAFGAIHGVGFASVLRSMELPRPALAWSLAAFNVGVEMGQLILGVGIGLGLSVLIARGEAWPRRVVLAGSLAVIAIGTYQFVQRVFFPGGFV
ncbi:MAG: HupE/UreJ family protein [Vicinamibacterales bacterium]